MSGARRLAARRLPLALRFALRDLAGDLRGFGVFIACIVIGVAAISGVGAVSRSLALGLAREGRVILGGDVSFGLVHRRLTGEERAFLASHGRLSQIALMRAMARSASGDAALVEIKAVDGSYPSAGAIELEPEQPLAGALRARDGVFGLVADSTLIARLGLKIGDPVTVGATTFQLRAALVKEPDKLAGGVGFGARVLMSEEALQATGLLQPGSIVRFLARVSLGDDGAQASDAEVDRFAELAASRFPEAGWEVRKRNAVSPQFSRNQERFTQLLTLVALTALVAGGAGVANAVDGFIAKKRDAYAILKALGAPASRVFAMALTEVLLVAASAIVSGLAFGASFPYLVDGLLARTIELPFSASIDPKDLAIGALYGLLVTLIFALPPLGRAHDIPVARLLRDDADEARAPSPRNYLLASCGAAVLLVGLVMATSTDKRLAATYIATTGAAFLSLWGVAGLVVAAARRLPAARDARLRHAIANIRRPHGLAPALIVSIGLTQTLLVALALVEGAIHGELSYTQRGKTPSFFFVDAPKSQADEFDAFLKSFAPDAHVEHVPMMRGRIVAVKGARAETVRATEDTAWVLEGDRGVTFSASLPAGSTLIKGSWWDKDVRGPPLVSLEAKVAEGLGLTLGDDISVNVLGREITARIANLRRVEWRSYGINFVMVFSPDTFADAPYSEMFTVAFENRDDARRDAALMREAAKRFPTIAAVRVKDALEAIEKIADQLTFAARAAAAIAVLTATLALASAVAASQRARLHDAVVLKTLGATRSWLTGAFIMEFAILGAVAGVFSVAAGTAAAAFIIETLMKMDFAFLPAPVAVTALGALFFTIALGLAGTWRVLGQRPAPALRRL
ncbi:MAG: glycosyl transferase family 1 [Methylocystaceae bacterium]|nr:MAG: glycosyl transferase family 1 [Methylocystaceae bacterium]